MTRSNACKSCGGPVSRTSRTGDCRQCYVRPLPADFAERSATMRQFELIRHYGASDIVVMRWAREAGTRPVPRSILAAPDDLADNAARMGAVQLARHYERGQRTIARWLKEAGLTALKSPPRPRTDYKPRPPRRMPSTPIEWKGPHQLRVPGRDTSLVDSAADHLRRLAPVHRCDERGRATDCAERRTHWRYGTLILTEDELFQRARRHGWEVVA